MFLINFVGVLYIVNMIITVLMYSVVKIITKPTFEKQGLKATKINFIKKTIMKVKIYFILLIPIYNYIYLYILLFILSQVYEGDEKYIEALLKSGKVEKVGKANGI